MVRSPGRSITFMNTNNIYKINISQKLVFKKIKCCNFDKKITALDLGIISCGPHSLLVSRRWKISYLRTWIPPLSKVIDKYTNKKGFSALILGAMQNTIVNRLYAAVCAKVSNATFGWRIGHHSVKLHVCDVCKAFDYLEETFEMPNATHGNEFKSTLASPPTVRLTKPKMGWLKRNRPISAKCYM